MKPYRLIKYVLAFIILMPCTVTQTITAKTPTAKRSVMSQKMSKDTFNVMFYNVENFFDIVDDPNTSDEDFTPEGLKHWSKSHMYEKNAKVGKVIVSAAGWNLPVLVGLAEVENDTIGRMLTEQSPLRNLGYGYLHQESQDRRGIDVMLLYRKSEYEPITTSFYPVEYPADTSFRSRDILYSKGVLGGDTLHVFVNHWPSKYGGVMGTIPLRKAAALTLKKRTDSIMALNPMAKIIIMGDLNDAAQEPSIIEALEAGRYKSPLADKSLINLSWANIDKGIGSNKYHGDWSIIDHIIVSKGLLEGPGLSTTPDGMVVLQLDFLMEADDKYMGRQPNRTYLGMKYHGGFSDHLPVMLQLTK